MLREFDQVEGEDEVEVTKTKKTTKKEATAKKKKTIRQEEEKECVKRRTRFSPHRCHAHLFEDLLINETALLGGTRSEIQATTHEIVDTFSTRAAEMSQKKWGFGFTFTKTIKRKVDAFELDRRTIFYTG